MIEFTMKSKYCYDFSGIKIEIAEENGAISHVCFCGKKSEKLLAGFSQNETPLLKKAAFQLREYFDGKRTAFDLPLAPRGTSFQAAVWKALQTIPYGQTRSYKDIALLAGSPKACRAVGMANNRNPIAIIVPCHRVVGSDGSLTGYAGGLGLKERLLALEKSAAVH
jgi:methylated-DNA-[protein]-cysteine S-methyltransferase